MSNTSTSITLDQLPQALDSFLKENSLPESLELLFKFQDYFIFFTEEEYKNLLELSKSPDIWIPMQTYSSQDKIIRLQTKANLLSSFHVSVNTGQQYV